MTGVTAQVQSMARAEMPATMAGVVNTAAVAVAATKATHRLRSRLVISAPLGGGRMPPRVLRCVGCQWMARPTGRPRGGQQLLVSSARQRISMSLRDWLLIDARMDNTQQSARDDYDHHLAARAGAIRQHG